MDSTKHNGSLSIGLMLLIIALPHAGKAQAAEASRVWKNQQGRELKASLVDVRGAEVWLKLDNGITSKVQLASLSPADQAYATHWSQKPAGKAAGATNQTAAGPALVWPAAVTIDPKALEIIVGEQNAAKREYEYRSGSFRYVAKAPLTGTVMKDVAGDFELASEFVRQLPWGWVPKPKDGGSFKVYLTETNQDFIDLGGNDTSGGGAKDDYVFLKFSSLGLKKVGPRYAFDARGRSEGEVMGLTMQLLIGDMRNLLEPWSAVGLDEFIRKMAYHKGALRLSRLDPALKETIVAETRTKPDLKRMLAYLHMPYKEQRNDVKQIRVENHFDGMMLVYFFGFLDGDGKGSRLHEYYTAVAQESLGWRALRESNGKTPRPRPAGAGSYPEWSAELMKIVVADRTDEQLRSEMAAKFKAIGVKVE